MVPRGTTPHWSTRYPTVASFPEELAAWESEVSGYQAPDPLSIAPGEKIVDYLQERRRERVAGFAHSERLVVDGGCVVKLRSRKHIDWIGIMVCSMIGGALGLAVLRELLR